MRFVLAAIVAFALAACALQQSASERGFVRGDSARDSQAALDAEAILQGMSQARNDNQRMARDSSPSNPGLIPSAVTR